MGLGGGCFDETMRQKPLAGVHMPDLGACLRSVLNPRLKGAGPGPGEQL